MPISMPIGVSMSVVMRKSLRAGAAATLAAQDGRTP
jgi:hypothetical protein